MPTGKSQYRKGEYPTFEDYSIYAQRVVLNGEFVQHSHDFDEIVLILSGTGEHLVGQRLYSLKRGDVFVIKGETHHGFRGAENLELVNVMYDPRILLSGEGDLRAVAGFAYLFLVQPAIAQQEEYPYAVFLDEDATETASTLCGFLIRQLEDCAGQYQVAVQYGFKTLAAYLANHYRTREDLSEKLGIFTRAVQYLQYNAARPIKLQEVAEAAAVSQRHLERVFFEVCGLSPIAYLLELRLRHASLLLRGTSKTVAEIAGECGFEDPSYFARVFKRKYGAPPNQCRNAKAL